MRSFMFSQLESLDTFLLVEQNRSSDSSSGSVLVPDMFLPISSTLCLILFQMIQKSIRVVSMLRGVCLISLLCLLSV